MIRVRISRHFVTRSSNTPCWLLRYLYCLARYCQGSLLTDLNFTLVQYVEVKLICVHPKWLQCKHWGMWRQLNQHPLGSDCAAVRLNISVLMNIQSKHPQNSWLLVNQYITRSVSLVVFSYWELRFKLFLSPRWGVFGDFQTSYLNGSYPSLPILYKSCALFFVEKEIKTVCFFLITVKPLGDLESKFICSH